MKFSTDQYNELNTARRKFNEARKFIAEANKGFVTKSFAMTEYNNAKKALADICNKARGIATAERHTPDFDSTVAGIPCGVVLISYYPGSPAKLFGLPENCTEEEPSEFNFFLVDTKGYKAQWLEEKLTDDDCARLEREFVA